MPSFFLALEHLRQSDMVAFMPSRLLSCEGLFEVPLENPPGFQVVAAYHPSALSDPLLTLVLDHVRTKFGTTEPDRAVPAPAAHAAAGVRRPRVIVADPLGLHLRVLLTLGLPEARHARTHAGIKQR